MVAETASKAGPRRRRWVSLCVGFTALVVAAGEVMAEKEPRQLPPAPPGYKYVEVDVPPDPRLVQMEKERARERRERYARSLEPAPVDLTPRMIFAAGEPFGMGMGLGLSIGVKVSGRTRLGMAAHALVRLAVDSVDCSTAQCPGRTMGVGLHLNHPIFLNRFMDLNLILDLNRAWYDYKSRPLDYEADDTPVRHGEVGFSAMPGVAIDFISRGEEGHFGGGPMLAVLFTDMAYGSQTVVGMQMRIGF
jgi:hypothetical protein